MLGGGDEQAPPPPREPDPVPALREGDLTCAFTLTPKRPSSMDKRSPMLDLASALIFLGGFGLGATAALLLVAWIVWDMSRPVP